MKAIQMSIPGVAAVALLASGLAMAGSLGESPRPAAEGQAVVTELGDNARAVTYWSSQPQGAVVVTTVDTVSAADTDAEQHAVVRLQSTLQPGQTQVISVPLAAGETQPVLLIARDGDRVTVSKVTE